ncbi:hypothetical protein Pan44_35890 [Caulifigura coniformis]|uniref:DUF3500 domain-containing protein n=1 Tax=Caulifigura coniformis TaxID=2527983 RepID=A0A517SHF2_9PLAN|nr:DUF3500 domain-containing protein [Caulifigura coniformis]QDT55545.1 hypothetical protein Pan44_35890 [Caulifigura coniformis]
MQPRKSCPDCVESLNVDSSSPVTDRSESVEIKHVDRRLFMSTAAAGAAITVLPKSAFSDTPSRPEPENLVEKLYESLTDTQRSKICFAWDHTDKRGLLRTHVSNNWSITDAKTMNVGGSFFTADQRDMIEAIFYGLYNPEWHGRVKKQLQDDAGGYGKAQTIALFGEPGKGKFEFVMTGRHLTIRCDGNSTDHVAFGGPIFYGHQASKEFDEQKDHVGNVFWPQALKANSLYKMLDGKQQKQALVKEAPDESEVKFQGAKGSLPGIRIAELSSDQVGVVKGVLDSLIEPYRVSDQDEAKKCLEKQGGLEKCSLAFYQSDDIGEDGVWDIWRLEGPSFVWHFRGSPHVHVWVNVADDPSPVLNAVG